MEKVIKVSIGNVAFTLEMQAYELMQDYLDRLQRHYGGSVNCAEILSEIESRISELLTERGYKEKVIPEETVREIIDILGYPEDFDGNSEGQHTCHGRKRLYRNPGDRIAGGVCGGLGAYFSVDPLVFRIIFAVWVLFFFWLRIFDDWGWSMSVLGIFAYLVLWIAMPEARTVEQRYNMKGRSVSIRNLQRTMEREARSIGNKVGEGIRDGARNTSGLWKAIGRCLAIFAGALLFLAGMAGCVSILLAVFGIGIWDGIHSFGLSWFISVLTDTPAWVSVTVSVLACIAAVLPFIGMLYAGTMLLFRLRSPRWRPGMIIFIVWTVSVLGLIGISLGSFTAIRNTDSTFRESALPVRDTLYIEFSGSSAWRDADVLIDADRNSYDLLYMGKNGSEPCLVVYPDLNVLSSRDSSSCLIATSRYVSEGITISQMNDRKTRNFWTFDPVTGTLSIDPIIFSRDIKVSDIHREISLYLNPGTRVIVREPVHHEFEGRFDYCSSRFLKIIDDIR